MDNKNSKDNQFISVVDTRRDIVGQNIGFVELSRINTMKRTDGAENGEIYFVIQFIGESKCSGFFAQSVLKRNDFYSKSFPNLLILNKIKFLLD